MSGLSWLILNFGYSGKLCVCGRRFFFEPKGDPQNTGLPANTSALFPELFPTEAYGYAGPGPQALMRLSKDVSG